MLSGAAHRIGSHRQTVMFSCSTICRAYRPRSRTPFAVSQLGAAFPHERSTPKIAPFAAIFLFRRHEKGREAEQQAPREPPLSESQLARGRALLAAAAALLRPIGTRSRVRSLDAQPAD